MQCDAHFSFPLSVDKHKYRYAILNPLLSACGLPFSEDEFSSAFFLSPVNRCVPCQAINIFPEGWMHFRIAFSHLQITLTLSLSALSGKQAPPGKSPDRFTKLIKFHPHNSFSLPSLLLPKEKGSILTPTSTIQVIDHFCCQQCQWRAKKCPSILGCA